jgi:hypothetical protein
MRRPILTAAAPACLLLGLTPVSAVADVAPAGNANAAAARVSDVAGISNSRATANDSSANAKAAVISLGDKPALGTGGAQNTEGESGGALIDTGKTLPVQARVAPWKASAKGAKGSARRSSRASAALAEVEVPDTAKVGLLTSDAAAEHTNAKSHGKSSSNAADISLGGNSAEHTNAKSHGKSSSNAADILLGGTTRLVLLHSEVDETAKGHAYLVGVNGTEIGTDEQFKNCALDASGVLSLSCLTASGGVANGVTSGQAEVLGVETVLGLNPVGAFTSAGTMAIGTSILESVGAAVPVAEAPRAAAAPAPPPAGSSVSLPRTGVAAASLAASALAALLTGLVLRLFGRRRATA